MTTPPNYRRVECCGTCAHGKYFCVGVLYCGMFPFENNVLVNIVHICDDYEPEDGE